MAPHVYPLNIATSRKEISRSELREENKHPQVKGPQKSKESGLLQILDGANHRTGKSKETSSGSPSYAVPVASDVQATAIPDPIPADSVSTSTIRPTTLTVSPTFSLNATSTKQAASSEPIPHIRSTTTVWIPAKATSSLIEGVTESGSTQMSPSGASGRLPTPAIILLAIGAVGLALAVILVLRCILCRNGRVDLPRPSAPILQESPLFGGKERFSFNNLLVPHAKPEKGDGWRPLSGGKELPSEKTQNRRHSILATADLAASNDHLSPASVYTTLAPYAPTTVGVALEFPVPPQAVNSVTQPLRVKNNGKEGKTMRRRSVTTTSLYGNTDIASPTLTDAETAYQAPRPAPTPGKSKAALKPSGSSRDNAQRPSRKNRASQGSLYRTPSGSRGREKEEPFRYAIPSVKDQERRDRDTKALTSALGLGSPPPPPSSCFSPVSIYPDDSLSVAYGRDYVRPPSEAPLLEVPSPSVTHAALGDLMLQDFPSTATFNSLRTGDPFAGEPVGKKSMKGRVNDRPPRVPSPPPLPSLSQMALANADADYRSPTYSIYGLYEAQRKSKRSSMGK